MNTLSLTKKLVALPSYVNKTQHESAVAEYIVDFLSENTSMRIEKQYINDDRYNIIATGPGTPRILFAGHMDTVEPKQGWRTDQFTCTEKAGKLYGLGVADMKSGIAAMLVAAVNIRNYAGLQLLFYCDEEYDFDGMKMFIDEYTYPSIECAVIGEPSDMKIWNAHRGLVEIECAIEGATGHASRPANGNNAIDALYSILNETKQWLQKNIDPVLGTASFNIAALHGGLNRGVDNNGNRDIGRQGNNIADYADAVIDIRTTIPEQCAQHIAEYIEQRAAAYDTRILDSTIRHDLGRLHTPMNDIAAIQQIVERITGNTDPLDPSTKGYGDGQLLQEAWGIPVINFGPIGGNMHAPNEWVDINSLEKTQRVYKEIIHAYCPQ